MSRRSLVFALAATSAIVLAPAPADALQFATSSTTGKGGTLYPLRLDGASIGPVWLMAGIRIMPGLSNLLGAPILPSGQSELYSFGLDADLGLAYKYTIADINFLGRFNPSISPFLGYRGLVGFTGGGGASLTGANGQNITSIVHGLNYGVKAETELPLGFSAFSQLGFTTLMGGQYDVREVNTTSSGAIAPGGATLPSFGFGAAWSLGPVFRIWAGYDIFQLPTDFRATNATLGAGRSTINNLTVGISLLGFSI